MTWMHPFDKKTITSRFGDNKPPRTNPHRGLDYAPRSRSIIPAITDGIVTRIFYNGCLGWVCEFQSSDGGVFIGHSHLYCNKHNSINCNGSDHEDGSTCMKSLKVGDAVTTGQPVGRTGNSGTCSRGAHLHLTFAKRSNPATARTFNPEKFIDQKLAKQERKTNALRQTKKAKEIEVCKCCQRPL